ncbi:MAG: helix-turn-helix domain-containing protein [Pirellulales bacterium]
MATPTLQQFAAGPPLLTMRQVSDMLPGRPSRKTIWRWRTQGIGGVRLAFVSVGKRHYVKPDALESFLLATQPQTASDVESPIAPPQSPCP